VSVEKYHSTNVFFQARKSIYGTTRSPTSTRRQRLIANRPVPFADHAARFQVGYANIAGQAEPVQR